MHDLDQVALEAAQKWRQIWLKDKSDETAETVRDCVVTAMQDFIVQRAMKLAFETSEKDETFGRRIDSVICNWLRSGEIKLSKPSESTRKAIAHGLSKPLYSPRDLRKASAKQKAEIFKDISAGRTIKQVADRFAMEEKDVETINEAAKREIGDLVWRLADFGINTTNR